MTAPKRIILEDTGERRYPKDNEPYVVLNNRPAPFLRGEPTQGSVVDHLFTAEWYDAWDDVASKPEDFAIYRIVEAE